MNLEHFQKFRKTKVLKDTGVKEIWGYTRVSSKDQANNFSLEEQAKEIREYASKNSYELTRTLGGTYESAKKDVTRKEFNKLISDVAKAKIKPFAIAIKFINRFSRSGGSAIAIVEELAKVNVHLIETSTGLCTANEHDKHAIQKKLLDAQKENMERLERTLPGMKILLEQGNWLGKPPRGYTLLGTKVKDFERRQHQQQIVINDEGKHIAKAWKWKLGGERDYVIREKLAQLGISMSKQQINAMWSKPFYCGVSSNALIDTVVKGKWEAMVTHREFMRVQKIIEDNKPNAKKRYSKSKVHEERPLVGTLICVCGTPLTGYEVRKKTTHYYKCQKCAKGNFNANTTKKSQTIGLNNLFEELLLKYALKDKYVQPFKEQMTKMLEILNQDGKLLVETLTKQISEASEKLYTLQFRYATESDFDKHIYHQFDEKLKQEIAEKSGEVEAAKKKISNHTNYIDEVVEKTKNISKIWALGDIENKLRVQRLVFPEGLQISPKNRQYLTSKVNMIFDIASGFTGDNERNENEKPTDNDGGSCLVAGNIQLSNQFLTDFYHIVELAGCY